MDELESLRTQIEILSAENTELSSLCSSWQAIANDLVDEGFTADIENRVCILMTKEVPTIVAVYRTAFEAAQAFASLISYYDEKTVLLLDTDVQDAACEALDRHNTVLRSFWAEGRDMVLPPQCVEKHCAYLGCSERCSDMDWCYGCKSYVCGRHIGDTLGSHETKDHWKIESDTNVCK